MSLEITPILAFTDNYIWILRKSGQSKVIIVDPGDATPVIQTLKTLSLEPSAIIITHHHMDHIGGIQALRLYWPVPVYGPKHDGVNDLDKSLTENDEIFFPEQNVKFRIMEIPGHTVGHIAYYNNDITFCGDTLFAGGCGRLFEGTPTQMYQSLSKLKHLPDQNQLFPAHEYTEANLRFAIAVEPHNVELQQRIKETNALRSIKKPTLPSTVLLEKNTNPFLRTHIPEVRNAAEIYAGRALENEIEVFATLRSWKDNFKS